MQKKQIISTILLLVVLLFTVSSTSMAATTLQKVTGLNARVENEKAYLNWIEVEDADGYDVYVAVSGNSYSKIGSVKKNRATINGFTKGKTYSVKIKAYEVVDGSKKYAEFSNAVSIKVPSTSEEQPDETEISKVTGLNVKVEDEKAYLNWIEVEDADGYDVYVAVSGNNYSKIGTVKSNRATLKGFTNGVEYKVKIKAYQLVNGSKKYAEFSNDVSIKIPKKSEGDSSETVTKPKKVTGLYAQVSGTKVYLNWNKLSDVDGYEMNISIPGYGNKTYDTKTVGRTLAGLTKNTTYTAKVRAYKYENGKKVYGDYSSTVSFKSKETTNSDNNTTTKPEKVTGLYAQVSGTRVYLNWNKLSKADGYEMNISIPGYGSKTYDTKTVGRTLAGLTKNTTYTAKVRAYKYENGKKVYGDYSSTVSFKSK